jgi:hypothetical protein
VGCLLHLDYFDSRRYFQDTKVVVPVGLPGRFVVVRRSLGVGRPLSSTCLVRAALTELAEYGNLGKLDIVRLSTRVRTTRC